MRCRKPAEQEAGKPTVYADVQAREEENQQESVEESGERQRRRGKP